VKKAVNDFIVLSNTALNASNFLIKLKSPIPLPDILPGQFVNVEIKNTNQIFLRRPFSVFEVDNNMWTISLLVKILGRGSGIFTNILPNDTISLVYPLGKGFSMPEMDDQILLIGGGSGVAPILFLAKTINDSKNNIDIIIGARTENDLFNIEEYKMYGQIHFITEDGSCGLKGRVTDHPLFKSDIKTYDKIYTCGPGPMMKAIAKEAKEKGIFCEVSLENLMACGFGVCLCCIEPTDKGNLCVCTDGPVFNINSLKW
jgi:dihydroorotate dehydrogenase electron transfer subunit